MNVREWHETVMFEPTPIFTPIVRCACGGWKIQRRHWCHRCDEARRPFRLAQRKAINAVTAIVAAGYMPPARELSCADCGEPAVHYDHRDYTKPLSVEPVCVRCNYKRGPAKC